MVANNSALDPGGGPQAPLDDGQNVLGLAVLLDRLGVGKDIDGQPALTCSLLRVAGR